MGHYNLAPGELVMLQERSVRLGAGQDGEELEELVLTSQNLILVASAAAGLFKRTQMLKRCPLSQIRRVGGAPQAFVTTLDDSYFLQVAFEDETVTLHFPANPRRLAERWERAICQAAAGDLSAAADVSPSDTLPPEITDVVDGARDLVGSLFGGSARKAAQTQRVDGARKDPATVSARCIGCHAPLSGLSGTAVTCPYCDTIQTL